MVWAKQVFNELFDFDVSGVKGRDFGFGLVGW
jgi:hypothetical protein